MAALTVTNGSLVVAGVTPTPNNITASTTDTINPAGYRMLALLINTGAASTAKLDDPNTPAPAYVSGFDPDISFTTANGEKLWVLNETLIARCKNPSTGFISITWGTGLSSATCKVIGIP